MQGDFPLAYLITVRCYGTLLHGDDSLSVDRHGLNVYGKPRREPNAQLKNVMRQNMTQRAVVLNVRQRAITKEAIKEVCDHRVYSLSAVRVLTNHFHVGVSAHSKPELIADAFKSYTTRKLRQTGLIAHHVRPWARGKSRRYLRKPKHVARAIEYVLYGQGDLPDFDDYSR
jgi:REP element-mobilizing transposase RayT